MRCAICGRELNDLARATGFCPSCGAPVTVAPSAPPPVAVPEPVIAPVAVPEPEIDPSSSAVMAFCANCGRPLTASAIAVGACPSCGAPVSLETPAAAPVAPPEPAPPAPEPVVVTETVVAAESVVTTSGGVTESAAAMVAETIVFAESPVTPPALASAPESIPVAPMPSMPMPSMPMPAESVPALQSQRGIAGAVIFGIIAAIIVLALLILFLLGRSGTGPFAAVPPTPVPAATATAIPTATAVPTPAVPAPAAGFQTFIAADNSYGLNYPSAWSSTSQTVNGTTGQVTFQLFVSPDGHDLFLTLPLPAQIPATQYPALIQAFVTGFASGSSNVVVGQTTTSVTISGRNWTEATGTLNYKGAPYKAIVLGTDHGTPTSTFVVVELAPAATFTSVSTADFTPIVASVAFAS